MKKSEHEKQKELIELAKRVIQLCSKEREAQDDDIGEPEDLLEVLNVPGVHVLEYCPDSRENLPYAFHISTLKQAIISNISAINERPRWKIIGADTDVDRLLKLADLIEQRLDDQAKKVGARE
jgi:hypothetical protein